MPVERAHYASRLQIFWDSATINQIMPQRSRSSLDSLNSMDNPVKGPSNRQLQRGGAGHALDWREVVARTGIAPVFQP